MDFIAKIDEGLQESIQWMKNARNMMKALAEDTAEAEEENDKLRAESEANKECIRNLKSKLGGIAEENEQLRMEAQSLKDELFNLRCENEHRM